MDGFADARDARRVGHREVGARLERRFRDDLDLAAEVHEEDSVADVDDLDAVHVARRADDVRAVLGRPGVDRQVADDRVAADAHDVNRADVAARAADATASPNVPVAEVSQQGPL